MTIEVMRATSANSAVPMNYPQTNMTPTPTAKAHVATRVVGTVVAGISSMSRRVRCQDVPKTAPEGSCIVADTLSVAKRDV